MAKELKELTKRADNYSQWYNDLVVKADLAEQSAVRGCMVIKPYGYAIWEKMQHELDKMFKETGAHLPAHHVAPLVAHQGQVAPRVNPVLISVPDDRLRCGADNQFLLQLGSGVNHHAAVGSLQAVVRHHGAFFGEAFHVFGFS